MGIILCLSLLLLEAALAIWRIKTKSMQRKITVILRTTSVMVLLALSLLSVIEWGFRYYALAATLMTLAAASSVPLLGKKVATAAYRRTRALWHAAAVIALVFIVSLPAMIFPEYQPVPPTGEYQVQTSVRYFTDESRIDAFYEQGEARTLAVQFWYPEHTAGNFPLIVFSHGAFGTRTSNETLFYELASHGYVVCSIDHTGQCLYTTLENGELRLVDSGYMGELRSENAKEDKQNSLALYKKWMGTRVADINFVIDAIIAQAKENSDKALFVLVDSEKIGVIGHSLGGAAALGVGRSRSDIDAVIALESPFLCDILAVENDSFVFVDEEYPAPVLNVYSDSSWTSLAEWPQYAQNVRLLSGQDKNAYSRYIAGAGHLSLTDLALFSPMLTRIWNGHRSFISAEDCLTQLNEICLPFFDCFLHNAATFEQ